MILDIRNLTQKKHKEQSFTHTLTMAFKGAVCGRVYAEMMEQMKKLKEENESLKEENESLKKSNAQKTKVIHRLRKELKETYDELKVENNDLEEEIKELTNEFDNYKGKYFLSPECEECNFLLTEDDIFASVECGHLCCENCRDEKEEEWENATDKIAQENSDLHNELKKLKIKLKDQATYEKRIFVLEQELNQKKKVLAKHGKKETSDSGGEQSSGEESEQSADDCVCITCECKFSDMKHKGKLGMDKRYAWYFGSEHDDGDMCSRCLRKLYKEYHP